MIVGTDGKYSALLSGRAGRKSPHRCVGHSRTVTQRQASPCKVASSEPSTGRPPAMPVPDDPWPPGREPEVDRRRPVAFRDSMSESFRSCTNRGRVRPAALPVSPRPTGGQAGDACQTDRRGESRIGGEEPAGSTAGSRSSGKLLLASGHPPCHVGSAASYFRSFMRSLFRMIGAHYRPGAEQSGPM